MDVWTKWAFLLWIFVGVCYVPLRGADLRPVGRICNHGAICSKPLGYGRWIDAVCSLMLSHLWPSSFAPPLCFRHPRTALSLKLSDENTDRLCSRYRNTSASLLAPSGGSCSPTTRMALAVASPLSSSPGQTPLPRPLRSSTDSSSMAAP